MRTKRENVRITGTRDYKREGSTGKSSEEYALFVISHNRVETCSHV